MDRYKKLVCVFHIPVTSKKLVEEEKMWVQLEHIFIDKNGKPMKGGADKKNKMVSGEISFPNGSIKIDSILRLI